MMPLVSVLWSIALLSATVTSLLFTAYVSSSLAHNASQIAAINAVTEAAINRAVLALLDPTDKRWPADGSTHTFDIATFHFRIRIQNELGRIDINHCDGSLLLSLFQSAGLQTQAAHNLVDRVLDWRESSSLRRLNGAKEREYRDAGYTYQPRNGPFQSVDELKLVMGMTPELFKRIEPALTVYSGRQFVDLQPAPQEVLAALTTVNADKAALSIASQSRQNSNLVTGAASNTSLDSINALKGRAFTIQAAITISNNVFIREATVRLTGNPSNPYWILSWQEK
jgi:general secretion pathway protein K